MYWLVFIQAFAASAGQATLETENRPEKQWVPKGAASLYHNDYVAEHWPSAQRFNFWIAQCKTEGCNALDQEHIERLQELNEAVLGIVVDGDDLLDDYPGADETEWNRYFSGTWSFEYSSADNRKCYEFGPFCGKAGILGVFAEDSEVITRMSDEEALLAINLWEDQTNFCPVTLARFDSPCVNTTAWLSSAGSDDCQVYNTTAERDNCRDSSQAYCDSVCPTQCFEVGDDCVGMVVPGETCEDSGCLSLFSFAQLTSSNTSTTTNATGEAPDSAFAFEPFELHTVASSGDGPAENSAGEIVSATTLFGFYALSETTIMYDDDVLDPVAEAWEEDALCTLGIIDAKNDGTVCEKDDLFDFTGNFARSLGDEFGAAILGDLGAFFGGCGGILLYMVVMLSRRDSVHSMIGMSCVTLLIVLLSFSSCMGTGSYIGLKNNNLINTIFFLLLGLGVDDTFVLSSEFFRAKKDNPQGTTTDHIAAAAKSGGMSVLITSFTDALAFIVGASTVLPALSWFCAFAGLGVIFCFIFQFTIFLPCLAMNDRRAQNNKYDCCCCCKAGTQRDYEKPQGCCCPQFVIAKLPCCTQTDILSSVLEKFGKFITTNPGRPIVLFLFLGINITGIIGTTVLYKDFKLEWFFPEGSYVRDFFALNEEYFSTGTPFSVYVRDVDYFTFQAELNELSTLLETTQYIDQGQGIDSWWNEFLTASQDSDDVSVYLNDAGDEFVSETDFYRELHEWYSIGGGVRYRGSIKWSDEDCENSTIWETEACDYTEGLLDSKMGATLGLAYVNEGFDRYNTMIAMREEITDIMGTKDGEPAAFPFSFQFLYWEDVGIIDVELIRNLLICGAVVICVIAAMIPVFRIAFFVILAVIFSVVDLVGFLGWWGTTVNGVSTIYILISVGLAVDYSAHIAHIFVINKGNSQDRAIGALTRIGPSVFNAVGSTLVAVFALSFSKTYVFETFFRALTLIVVFGGSHGLVWLPTMLSLFGGDNLDNDEVTPATQPEQVEMNAVKTNKDSPKTESAKSSEKASGDELPGKVETPALP